MFAACLLPICGCTHTPVYPEVGDAIIDSQPQGAEVLIDGELKHQMTPCRLNGLTAGTHRLNLCFNNYKTLEADIVVKPGQAIRLNYTLAHVKFAKLLAVSFGTSGRCMAFDRFSNDVYVATGSYDILRYHLGDSSITGPDRIRVAGPQSALAVNSGQARLYYIYWAQGRNWLACCDLNTGLELRRYAQPDSSSFRKLALSPDGNLVLVADSLGRRLLVLDSRLFSMVKGIPLTGYPSDMIFGESSDQVFVTLCGSKRLVRVDLEAGVERDWAPTGNVPRGLFWSLDRTQIGCCNSTDKKLTLVDVQTWASAIVMDGTVGGAKFISACWTDDPFYLMVLIEGNSGMPGSLNIAYVRNWFTTNYLVMYNPISIARLPALKRYVILTRDTIMLARGDFN